MRARASERAQASASKGPAVLCARAVDQDGDRAQGILMALARIKLELNLASILKLQ